MLKGAKFRVVPYTQKAEARRSGLQDQPVLQNPEVYYLINVYIWGHGYRTKSIKWFGRKISLDYYKNWGPEGMAHSLVKSIGHSSRNLGFDPSIHKAVHNEL